MEDVFVTHIFNTKPSWINTLLPSDAIWRLRFRSTLVLAMACCLTAPSDYLNQCWLPISQALWHSPENSFTARAQATILCNEFKNYCHIFQAVFETQSKKLWVLMPWISNHKNEIDEKSSKSSRPASKVVGLGPADLWEFPTLLPGTMSSLILYFYLIISLWRTLM